MNNRHTRHIEFYKAYFVEVGRYLSKCCTSHVLPDTFKWLYQQLPLMIIRAITFQVWILYLCLFSIFTSTSLQASEMALSPTDPNSFSRPDLAIVTHIHFQLNVDFGKKILSGNVVLDVEQKGDTDVLILDDRGIVIKSIVNDVDNTSLDFNVGSAVAFGSKLTVNLPSESITSDEDIKKYKIKIEYETSPNATALQWLTADQTAGGKHPYLFSQCQAIHARSMFPCQDSPSVKFTYSAEITAPKALTALMSALLENVTEADDSQKVYKFRQPIPIPSYLVAIAVGAIVSKKVGPRSSIWAEQEQVDDGVYEFEETETMLQTAEDICGPYVWGVYDLLILPPSFPFGGMENPCLTFVTPTLLAGDRSLASVVAHEISHSWTGNLVTNANFEHFWLNEGFTEFVERKINGRMFNEQMRHFQALDGLKKLQEEIRVFGATNQLTNLVPDLKGIDPDDAFSVVPYEKGHTFLFYLEQLLGGPEKFDPFLKSYLNTFKYKSITTEDFKKYLFDYFSNYSEILKSVDWETWLYKPGMPPVIPDYDTSLSVACSNLANRWLSWDDTSEVPFTASDISSLSANQKIAFLSDLYAADTVLPFKKLQKMQEIYDFDSIKNSEIRFIWLRLCLKSRWAAKVSAALEFATKQGRMKFVSPIFRDLYEWEEMRQRAIDTYLSKKNKMMYVTAHAVAKELHLQD